MTVMKTNEWLYEDYHDPIQLCKKIKPLFPSISAKEIYDYFRFHGMYHEPDIKGTTLVETMMKYDTWKIVETEFLALQKKWKGPDVPIIILPSNTKDKKLMKQTNGKAGLAFSDKLFLFVPERISEHELKALFIHEYNHVCRLWHTRKDENSYTLLDSIILEGLAEHAVRERLGDAFTAPWTNFHSNEKLIKFWQEIISPQKELLKSHPLHDRFLFGWNGIPRMAGYCVGYYLVGTYLKTNHLSIDEILNRNSEIISTLHPAG